MLGSARQEPHHVLGSARQSPITCSLRRALELVSFWAFWFGGNLNCKQANSETNSETSDEELSSEYFKQQQQAIPNHCAKQGRGDDPVRCKWRMKAFSRILDGEGESLPLEVMPLRCVGVMLG